MKNSIKNKKFETLKIVTVSGAHTMHDTYSGFISPLLPFLINQLGLLKVQAGFFSFVYQGLAVFQPLIGHTADKRNIIKFALIAPGVTGVAMSLLGVAPTFSTALILCGIGGFSSAIMHAVLPPVVSSLASKDISRGMSIWMVGGQIGMLLGPILITAIVGAFSLKATPWLMIPGVVIAILLNILLKDMKTINPAVNGNSSHSIPVKKLLTVMLPIAAVALMRSFLRSSALNFMSVYLDEEGFSIWMIGIAITIFKASGILGTILSGFTSRFLGFRMIFTISLLLSAIAMIGFVNLDGALQLICLGLIGLASMMIIPVGMATIQSHFPDNRSLANGIYLALLFAINAASGIATGAMYDAMGGARTFLNSSYIAMAGLPFILLFPKEKAPEVSVEEMTID